MTFRSGLIYKQIKQLNFIIKFCKSLLGVSAWFIPTCRGGRQVSRKGDFWLMQK